MRPERPNLRPERPGLRAEMRGWIGVTETLDLRPERPDLWPERLDLRPESQGLGAERPDGGGEGRTNERTDEQMDK